MLLYMTLSVNSLIDLKTKSKDHTKAKSTEIQGHPPGTHLPDNRYLHNNGA